MAEATKKGGQGATPGYSAIETIAEHDVFDGLGGRHIKGTLLKVVDVADDEVNVGVEVPRWVADLLLAKDQVRIADGSGIAAAKARGKAKAEEARQASQKANAAAAQRSYDDMPAELRALAQQHGDEVVALWVQGESADDILKAYGA